MTARPRPWFAPALALAVAGAVGCHAQLDTFYETVFTCNAAGPADQCGHTREGRPMICFPGSQLGGDDFCAEACDPTASVADPSRFACLDSGALLQICHPKGPDAASFDCPAGLSCFRTDLFSEVGLCVSRGVCNEDPDCKGNVRSTCATTIVHEVISSTITTDHLQCVETGCKSRSSTCPAGELCLGALIDHGPIVNDLCVPTCDSNLRCPPTFSCANNPTAAPGAPEICEPGVLGARCVHDQDCIMGSCVDIGLEFNVCAFPRGCTQDSDCKMFNTGLDTFVCADGNPGVCTTVGLFHGVDCKNVGTSSDCAPGTGLECNDYSPYMLVFRHGECRMPCRDDGTCPSRGGIPHTCLGAQHEGGCYPGQFGMPCTDPSQCLHDLGCQPVPPDPRSASNYSPGICTLPCATDDECQTNPLVPGYCTCGPDGVDSADGACRNGMGVCRPGGWNGTPCRRHVQCSSMNCNMATNTCVAAVVN